MKSGLFTEFSYPGKSERQTYAEVLEQIAVADELGFDFLPTMESCDKDLFSCSLLRLGIYVAAAQRPRRRGFRILRASSLAGKFDSPAPSG